MERISESEMLMGVARVIASRSTCSRANVGALLAVYGRIIATGYNGAPSGMPHCNHDCDCDHSKLMSFRAHSPQCNSLKPCYVSVHAEANAIAFAAKYGTRTQGSVLYCTLAPCFTCSQLLINAGVSKVVFGDEYRATDGVKLLWDAGVKINRLKEA